MWVKGFKQLLKEFMGEEAQATAEYILMLSVVVYMVLLGAKTLIQPVFQKLGDLLNGYFSAQFTPQSLHHFRL
jgi:hypothetical protein